MRFLQYLVFSCLVSLLAGCSDSSAPVTVTPAAQQVVGVSGNHMTLNGSTWLSQGIVLQGFVQPSAAFIKEGDTARTTAFQSYGPAEFAAIRAFGADTIRMQIGQPSLDPANTALYDPTYLQEIVTAVKLARQSGFVVMLMMQDEMPISGETIPHPLAIQETQNDWDLLNAVFANDPGVLYELYNEPRLTTATPADWALWLNGDTTGTSTAAPGAIGMQTMITHLRGSGAKNVFVLDGLDFAHTLNGLPSVTDPLNEVVYAVHPYPMGSADESQWDSQFGTLSQTLPVWVDEWTAGSDMTIGLGKPPGPYVSTPQVAVDFLNYVQAHKLPLCSGAFDVPLFIVQNVPGWTPYTNYDSYAPTSPGDNAGQLIHTLFMTQYGRPLTLADGL